MEQFLNIAGTVFDKGIKTYIPIGYECYSACSFIFFAGSEKYALGELGVHQAAYADDISKEKAAIGAVTTASQLTTADILLRLGEFNTPRFVEQRMLPLAVLLRNSGSGELDVQQTPDIDDMTCRETSNT